MMVNVNKSFKVTDSRKHGGKRRAPVTVLIPHHAAGVMSGRNLASYMKTTSRQISATYCIGGDGDSYLTLDESLEPYTTGNRSIDTKAITFEIANSTGHPTYRVTDKALDELVRLSIDICRRHGIKKLYFDGTKSGSNVHLHEWYQNTNCPGPYVKSKVMDYINRVNQGLNGGSVVNRPNPNKSLEMVVKEVIAGKYGNGIDRINKLKSEGYNPNEIQKMVNAKLVKPKKKTHNQVADEVIRGLWGNGNDRKVRIEKAGYNYNTVQSIVNKKMGV